MKMAYNLLLILAFSCFGMYPAYTQQYCHNTEMLGIGGYDPVAYHQKNKAVIGNVEIIAKYDGVNYAFESEQNRQLFQQSPKQYLPQFGGWCSMTLAMGRATEPDFTNFWIDDDGRLFLFERTLSVNGREMWLMDPKANEKDAANNYEKHLTGEL
jgi:YHS domain-containing protein